MEFPCGLCREPLEGVEKLKLHVKVEHEVVKYRMDLVVALSTLDTWEEKRLAEVGKQRLASLEVSGQCEKGGLFLVEVNSKKLRKDDKEGMRIELEEIRKMLLESSDDQDEDLEERSDKEDVEIVEVFESGPKEPRNGVLEMRRVKLESCPETPPCLTPPPSLPPTPCRDPEEMEVEVLEIIEKHQKLTETKSERKVKSEEKTPSAPPTPRSSPMSDVARQYSIKIEPEIEMVVDGVPQTEDPEEVEGGVVDQSLPFCRLCYITFTSHTDQLPHEQQVHSSDQDRRALNADMTQLTLEDFSNNCGICALKFLTKNSVIHHQKVEHRVGVERTVQCEKCNKVMKPSSIYLHRKTHQEKEFVCKLCYASYRVVSDLKKHEENKHKEDQVFLEQEITQDDLRHQCDRCDLKFVAEKFLENHVKSHKSKTEKMAEKAKECRLCYKPYRFTRELNLHEERQHKREAEFLHREILDSDLSHSCSKCDKKFVSANLLGSHSRLHELEKYSNLKIESFDAVKNKFECKFCYSSHQRFMGLLDHIHFAHSSDLDRINEKIITADLIFPCNNCDKMFITEDILSYHTRRFHTTKPKKLNLTKTQKCENCSEAFIHFNTLRKHSLAAHGTRLQRPIEIINCRLCEKPVKGKGNLATHVRNRHKGVEEIEALKLDKIEEGSLQFRCGYCYKKFLTKNVLNCHRQFCKDVERKNQNCELCPETFRHRHLLKKHCLTVHNKKLREKIVYCKLCGKSIRGNHNLRAHEKSIHKSAEEIDALKLDKIEDENLTFNCQHCNKRFLNEKVLRHHNTFCYGRSNHESSQRDCSLCLVEFASNRVLKEHVNNVHRTNAEEMKALKSPETVSLKSKCKFCQADVLNKHVLKYHYDKVHREEEAKKTWSCEFCKKEFKPDRIRTTLVGQHMRDEHDLPEYNCLEVKVESNKLVTNQAKQNFQLMLSKMLGGKS